MPSVKRKFGDIGEKEAENFLIESGYKIVDRNYRVKNLGEIDIVAEKIDKLHFFEVKTRDVKHETTFPIEASINYKKRANLRRICEIYLANRRITLDKDWQVDAIFVQVNSDGQYNIKHFENILWEEYY